MKKLLALLLSLLMVFSLTACLGDKNPSGNDDKPGTSQQGGQNDDQGEQKDNPLAYLEKDYGLTGIKAPEGSTFEKRQFKKDGGFTEAEIDALAKQLWESCKSVSTDGIYNTKTVDFNTGAQGKDKEYAELSEAKRTDEYYWCYSYNDTIYMLRLYFGEYQSSLLLDISKVQ